MVTTVFRKESGLNVDLPEAKRIIKLEAKKNVANIYANLEGEISIDDKFVQMGDIRTVMYKKRVEIPKLTVSLKIDKFANMGLLTDIHSELRKADALKVNYCAVYGN